MSALWLRSWAANNSYLDTVDRIPLEIFNNFEEQLWEQLRKAGYTTLEAGSGEEGLRIARAERPAVIFLTLSIRFPDNFRTP